MTFSFDAFDSSFSLGLAGSIIHPGLQNVLILDANPEQLTQIVHFYKEIYFSVNRIELKEKFLNSTVSEDELWGNISFDEAKTAKDDELFSITWQKGIFSPIADGNKFMVAIPDLSRLSIPAARACISLMDSPMAYIERHGKQFQWKPEIIWFAGCKREYITRVSPHLLDRFMLRLSLNHSSKTIRKEKVIQTLSRDPNFIDELSEFTIDRDILDTLTKAKEYSPEWNQEAFQEINEYIFPEESISLRRDIALARLSYAIAQIENSPSITINHIEKSASVFSLQKRSPLRPNPLIPSEENKSESTVDEQKATSNYIAQDSPTSAIDVSENIKEIDESAMTTPDVDLPPQETSPWPEDNSPIDRDLASLKIPWYRQSQINQHYGVIIGVEKSRRLSDLAIFSTIIEAAKFQVIRHKEHGLNDHNLIISISDIRSYIRAPISSKIFILVLDYTCLKGIKWQEALLPFFFWAYFNRATVCLIQVGSKASKNSLCAERNIEKNILSHRFNHLLFSEAGKSTPLAHGLELARRTLDEMLQKGKNSYREATLVVLSDGRGNIPLEASLTRKISGYINRQGVEDAIKVAFSMRNRKYTKIYFLNPQPLQYPEFPVNLAEAMNAITLSVELEET